MFYIVERGGSRIWKCWSLRRHSGWQWGTSGVWRSEVQWQAREGSL